MSASDKRKRFVIDAVIAGGAKVKVEIATSEPEFLLAMTI